MKEPKKNTKIYYTMGEVSEMFDVKPSLIRFWEQKFDILKPQKNKKGNRLFTPADIENLKLIYHLVKEKGMTLAGAQKRIKDNKNGLQRDIEVIDRLLSIKSVLMEIREELKAGSNDLYLPDDDTEQEQEMPEEGFSIEEEETAAEPDGAEKHLTDTDETQVNGTDGTDIFNRKIPDTGTVSPSPDLFADDDEELEKAIESEFGKLSGTSPWDDEDTYGNDEDIFNDALEQAGGGIPGTDDVRTENTAGTLFAETRNGAEKITAQDMETVISESVVAILETESPEPEYIAELSEELSEEASTAAEVMETLAELDGDKEGPKRPEIYDQTLF